MLILDLKWVLFAILCALVLALGGLAFALRGTPARSRKASRSPTIHPLDTPAFRILEGAPFGALVLRTGRVTYANQEARELLYLTDSESQGLPVDRSQTPDEGMPLPSADWADLLLDDVAVARREVTSIDEEAADQADGRLRSVTFPSGRTVRWWVHPQGAHDVVILQDVTGERRAQRTGRTLISDLGHELRTPIATLLTHLEILGLGDVGDEVRHQSLVLSRREAQRMSRLVNDMLELGRLETVESLVRRPLDLASLAEEVVLQATPRARTAGLSLDMVSPSSLPFALGNADRLRQVLLNLLDNALKYAGSGAKITVSLDRAGDGVTCAVCDTGPGISSEHLPYVTQRFYRAAPETVEGSGLGLSLVREVLRLHGSDLDLVSPVANGQGTCARFTLPIAGEQGQNRL